MKKLLLSIGVLGLMATTFQSCDKIKDEVKKQINPFNWTQQDIIVSIPPTSNDSASVTETVTINIQQILDDNVDGVDVSLSDISSIKIKKITISPAPAPNGFNATNNFTNFESLFFAANTDKGLNEGKLYQGVNAGINDDAASEYAPVILEFPAPQANLKDYFNATGNTTIHYLLMGNMREATTQEMKVSVKVEYEFAP